MLRRRHSNVAALLLILIFASALLLISSEDRPLSFVPTVKAKEVSVRTNNSKNQYIDKDSNLQRTFEEAKSEPVSQTVKQHDHNHDDDDDHHDNNNTNRKFCSGSFMTMFMDGFHWSILPRLSSSYTHHSSDHNSTADNSSTPPPPCLAYYVRTWKLDENGKFRGAMLFSFLLALLTEGLSRGRFTLIRFLHRRHGAKQRKLFLTVVYALQQWLGTMIMLISMMYSIEMLLSVVAGLMVGNFLFMREYDNNPPRAATMGPTTTTTTTITMNASGNNSSSSGGGGARRIADEDHHGLQLLVGTTAAASCCLDDGPAAGLQLQATRKED